MFLVAEFWQEAEWFLFQCMHMWTDVHVPDRKTCAINLWDI